MEIQKEISKKRLRRFLGSKTKVIVEGRDETSMTGRMLTQAPDIDGVAFIKGDCAIGEIREEDMERMMIVNCVNTTS